MKALESMAQVFMCMNKLEYYTKLAKGLESKEAQHSGKAEVDGGTAGRHPVL